MSRLNNLAVKQNEKEISSVNIKQVNKQVLLHNNKPHLLRNVSIMIAIVLILSYLLYLRVVQIEVDSNITTTNAQLTELKSEYIRLQMAVENSNSLKKFEEEAQQKHGLQKQNDNQVKYIDLQEQNKIEVLE